MGPALYMVHRLSPFYDVSKKKRGGLSTLHHCLWYMYGALLQQGLYCLKNMEKMELDIIIY